MEIDKDEQCHLLSSATEIKMKVHAGKYDHYLVNWGKRPVQKKRKRSLTYLTLKKKTR